MVEKSTFILSILFMLLQILLISAASSGIVPIFGVGKSRFPDIGTPTFVPASDCFIVAEFVPVEMLNNKINMPLGKFAVRKNIVILPKGKSQFG
jgi:hypothetical protein